jgi:hypothetical protein
MGIRRALVRFPIGGGDGELVQILAETGNLPHRVAHSQGNAYWIGDGGIYWATEARPEAQLFLRTEDELSQLKGTDESLFYARASGARGNPVELYRVPRDGGTPELIVTDGKVPFEPVGDYIYAAELPFQEAVPKTSYFIWRMPLAGGPWIRLAERAGEGSSRLNFVGDLVFYNHVLDDRVPGQAAQEHVMQGRMDDVSGATAIVVFESKSHWDWVGTPAGVFWTTGDGIHLRKNAIH